MDIFLFIVYFIQYGVIIGTIGYTLWQVFYIRIWNDFDYLLWLKKREPVFGENISMDGYPLDWQFRRLYAYRKQKGICASCGKKVGRLSLWIKPISSPVLKGIHLHHKVPISEGGKHYLDNLEISLEKKKQG